MCRCEAVTAQQVREAVALDCTHADSVKAKLRCGMGPCQGRTCSNVVTSLVAERAHMKHVDVGPYRIRPPLRSISLSESCKPGWRWMCGRVTGLRGGNGSALAIMRQTVFDRSFRPIVGFRSRSPQSGP
ncbi:(2Fe-2S)-binding protein [Cupriavidus necator]|uniref:(2Fe-2S)-binding protein n=1 Tax=Cupriavidus necator TaxID=106590 RepID=UPI003F50819E